VVGVGVLGIGVGVGGARVGVGASGVGVGGAGVGVGAFGTDVGVAVRDGTGIAVGPAQAERIAKARVSVMNIRQPRFISEPPDKRWWQVVQLWKDWASSTILPHFGQPAKQVIEIESNSTLC
jgi:hypothetical protein